MKNANTPKIGPDPDFFNRLAPTRRILLGLLDSFQPRFGLGLTTDLELQNYVIETEAGEALERDRVFIVTAIALVDCTALRWPR